MTRPRFLVVDDEDVVLRAFQQMLCRHGEMIGARTLDEAARLLVDGSIWDAFLFDVGLPDGSGLDLLARARLTHPVTPAMIFTGTIEAAAANAAYDMRAYYVVKPIASERIDQFLREATSRDSSISLVLLAWTTRYGLSDAEADLLGRTAHGESRKVIAAARGTSAETVKKQIAHLLSKTGDDSLHAAAERLLRDVARV